MPSSHIYSCSNISSHLHWPLEGQREGRDLKHLIYIICTDMSLLVGQLVWFHHEDTDPNITAGEQCQSAFSCCGRLILLYKITTQLLYCIVLFNHRWFYCSLVAININILLYKYWKHQKLEWNVHSPRQEGSAEGGWLKLPRTLLLLSIYWAQGMVLMWGVCEMKRQELLQPQPAHLAAVWQDIQKCTLPYQRTKEQLLFSSFEMSQFILST